MIKTMMAAAVLCAVSTAALADGTCKSNADDKKLHGAALTSFLKKCQRDAASTCDVNADDKKLHGAARTSFTKKCVNDAVGG